jgi:hypothetical protein
VSSGYLLYGKEKIDGKVRLKFISLQPFVDGNSRLSRLLMNGFYGRKAILQ